MSDVNKDVNGKDSIKRKWGAILITIDVIVFLLLFFLRFIFVIFGKSTEELPKIMSETLYDMWLWNLAIGASLLGLTIVEHITKFIQSKKGVS